MSGASKTSLGNEVPVYILINMSSLKSRPFFIDSSSFFPPPSQMDFLEGRGQPDFQFGFSKLIRRAAA